jgi:serine/threonine protein kinase
VSITGEPAERALRAGVSLRSGRYLLVAPLGRGGFASVWRARDARDKREVAIKLLPAGDGGREAAEREAEVTARVKHPNVVCVLDTFCEEGWAGIVMELALGSLATFRMPRGPTSCSATMS